KHAWLTLLTCQQELAAVLIASKEFAEAEVVARRALELASSDPEAGAMRHPLDLAGPQYELARSLRGLGRPEEAAAELALAVSVLDSLRKKPPTLHLEAVREYAQILKELGRTAEAEALERRIPKLEKARQEQYRLAGLPRELPVVPAKVAPSERVS